MKSEKDIPHSGDEPAEKKVSILVLKKYENSLNSAEPFLVNRNWNIQATTDLKLFLQKIFKDLPNFTMMSIDYPSPKILKLLSVVEINLKIPVILFSESSSPKVNLTMRESGHSHLLYHPLSGPMIERMLLKIQKQLRPEEAGGSNMATAIKGGSLNRENSTWSVGNHSNGVDSNSSDDIIYMRSEMARQQLTQLFKEDGGSSFLGTIDNENVESGGTYNPNDGTAGHRTNALSMKGTSAKKTSEANHTNLMPNQDTGSKPGADIASRIEAIVRFKFNSQEAENSSPAKLNLAIASERALVRASRVGDNNELHLVSNCNRVSCFSVKSPTVNGHLVVAFGNDRKMDESFSSSLKQFLIQYMAENGESISMEDAVSINLDEVSFDSWSIAEAHFLRKSVHEGSEVAIAFFPQETADAPLEISAESHMLKMSLDEVRVNQPVAFDLYLYLSANKKYVRYTPQSGLLYSDQKERLQQGGQTQIHIRENSSADVSRYRVQNFLNDMIKTHKKKPA